MIPYVYHFEICERPEIPDWLRSDIFLALSCVQKFVGLNKILESKVASYINALGQDSDLELVEMGTGSGDQIFTLSKNLHKRINVVATDKFPQIDSWRNKFQYSRNISWKKDSISFENFDRALSENKTVLFFNCAFHHMKNEKIKIFLKKTSARGISILILEPMERNILGLFFGAMGGFLAPLAVFNRGTPLKQRLRLLILAWVIPVLPFTNFHDGILSALRQRTDEEWETTAKEFNYSLNFSKNLGTFKNFKIISLQR
jgi:hypothetical protein